MATGEDARNEATESDRALVRAIAPAFILFGLVVRIWMLRNPIGGLDADEAIVGLMARHILDGEFPMFYWGQIHGGPHEPLLTAAFFQVLGSSTLVLKIVAVLLSAAACVLIWRIGKRTVGEPAATAAALLFWVWPAAFVWWSVKSRGFYHAALVIGLAILLLVLRLDRRATGRDMALLGALVATGFWASPQTALLSAPALLWLVVRRFSVLKIAPIGIAGAIAGAFPWWVHNLDNDWIALKASPASLAMPAYRDHLYAFFDIGLPGSLGLMLADGSRWIAGNFGKVCYGLLLALFALALLKLRGRSTLLVLVAAAYPFLLALSPFSWFMAHPRYLYYLAPVVALLLARGLAALRWPALVAGLVAAMTLTTSAFATMHKEGAFYPGAEGVRIPQDLDPLFDYMTANGIEHVYADYWLAYVVGFESAERIIATPYKGAIRNGAADAAVRSVPDPAYLFLEGSRTEPVFRQEIEAMGVAHARHEEHGFVIYALMQNVPPEALPGTQSTQP
ncbi:MAG: glycosyltransferase family 39 protein [Actinomycetota bacterium]|nr:glycosyltransferase family 39 protein [Actinomycetota bacterium]